MNHGHAHHDHGHHGPAEHVHAHAHAHDAAPAPQPALGGPSVLMLGAGARIGAALAAIALLWAAVAWALTDLAT